MKLLALAVLALSACSVDLHPSTDAAPCAPSTRYFVLTFWTQFIDANQCQTSGCHRFSDGHGYLRFRPAGNSPDPATPIAAWRSVWRDNYYAAVQLVRCDDPLKSRLLTVPEGKGDPHPPGVSIMDAPVAEQLLLDWVAAP